MFSRFLIALFFVSSLLLVATEAKAQTFTTYDPSLGTLPTQQGWSLGSSGSSPTPTVSGGILYQGLTSYSGEQFWERDDSSIDFSKGFTLQATLKVDSSTYSYPSPNGGVADSQRSGYYLSAIDTSGHDFELGIASTGITLNTDQWDSAANGITFKTVNTTDAFHNYAVSVSKGTISVYIDNILYGSTQVGSYTSSSPSQVWFGDGTGAGNSQTELSSLRYTPNAISLSPAAPEPCSIFLLLAGGLTGGTLWKRRRS